MAFPATGDPTQAFVDAVRTRLTADATLMALVTGVYGHLSEAARTAYPYLVLGRSSVLPSGAFQTSGGLLSLQIDAFSAHKGRSEAQGILSQVFVLLERYGLTVTGYQALGGSLAREYQDVFPEPDADSPDRTLYHGVQRWAIEVHDA